MRRVDNLVSKSGSLNLLKPSGPVQACDRDCLTFTYNIEEFSEVLLNAESTRVGTLIVATIYLQLIQDRYMFRSFIVLQCSHQHCVQPVASDVEVVGYL